MIIFLIAGIGIGVFIGVTIGHIYGFRPMKKAAEKALDAGRTSNELADHVVRCSQEMFRVAQEFERRGILTAEERRELQRTFTPFRSDHW